MQTIYYSNWGTIEYGKAWEQQEDLLKEALEQKRFFKDTPEDLRPPAPPTKHHLIFCTHPAVYTLGKSGKIEHLLVNEDRMKALEVSFYKTNRGGDITFHGPGQIVGYPVFDLEKIFTDLGKYMRSLEEIMIRVLAHYGLSGERLPGATGVWLDAAVPGKARKICAMGVRCSRWMTMHGFALNVNTDLRYFDYIVPCGIEDKGVTSLQKELGYQVDEDEVRELLKAEFGKVFEAIINTEEGDERPLAQVPDYSTNERFN